MTSIGAPGDAVTVAIIGAGIGREHLAAYQQLPDRFEVTTICDLDTARANKLAAKAPNSIVTADFDDVLASDVDLVDICLPPHLHLEACLAALDAGKAVICEKPLVASLAEADQLAERVAATGGFLSPVFQYRYGLGTAQFKALEAAGLIGSPHVATLETHWNRSSAYYAVDWRGTWATERGGAMLGHAIHIHDLVTHLLGPVAEVFAMLDTRVNDIEVEDCASVSMRMASGALATSSVTLGAAHDTSRLRLVCQRATVESSHEPYAPAAAAWTFTARNPKRQAEIDAVIAEVGGDAAIGYVGMFTAIADALDGRPGREVTLDDGRRSLEFVTAVYSSARRGESESLPILPSHALYESWLPRVP